jgi:hypothetical protein
MAITDSIQRQQYLPQLKKNLSTSTAFNHQQPISSIITWYPDLSSEEIEGIEQLLRLQQVWIDEYNETPDEAVPPSDPNLPGEHAAPEIEISFVRQDSTTTTSGPSTDVSTPGPTRRNDYANYSATSVGESTMVTTPKGNTTETSTDKDKDVIVGTPFSKTYFESDPTDDANINEPISAWSRDEKDNMSGKEIHKYQALLEAGAPGLFKPLNFHLLGNDLSDRKSLETIQAASDNLTAVKQFEKFLGRYGCIELFVHYELNGGMLVKKTSILHAWNKLTFDDVLQNDRYLRNGVPEPSKESIRRDLNFTMQAVLNSIADNGLKQEVLAEVFSLPPLHQTGPVIWFVLMRKIWKSDDMTFQTIKSKLFGFRLEHVPGMNVPLYIIPWQVIKNLLETRNIDTTDFNARLLLTLTRSGGAQPKQFKAHFETLKSMNDQRISDFSATLKEAASKYESLMGEGVWPQDKQKQTSIFSTQQTGPLPGQESTPQLDTKQLIDALVAATKSGIASNTPKASPKPTHDRSGNPIDRTPPRAGEPSERTKDGKTEYWCSDCGRWGNHSSGKPHTEWVAKMKSLREKFRGKGKGKGKGHAANGRDKKNTGANDGPMTRLVLPTAHFSYHLNF